jgi:hypothetical protein
VNIGEPERTIEIAPATLPLPEELPIPEQFPIPEPMTATPAR